MNNLSLSIQKFCKSGFKDNDAMNESLKLYENLNSGEKKLCEEKMYTIFRGKFDQCYTAAQYDKALKWLNKTKENPRFAKELTNNKAHFLVEAVKTLLMLYLENRDEKLLIDAKELFFDIKTSELENDTLKEIFEEDQAIISDVKHEFLWTRTSFLVPIALKTIENEVSIDIPYKNDKLHAVVSVRREGLNGNSASVSKLKDRDSVINSSKWTIWLNKYLSCEVTSEYDDTATVMQFYACNIVNRIIDAYREQTGEYWIKSIYPAMISGHSIEYGVGDKTIRKIPFFDHGKYQLSTQPISVNLESEYIRKKMPLYKLLLMEAKSYLLVGALRECVISLNSAFENFTYVVVCSSIVANSNGEYAQNFYLKVQQYQDYFLHDYLTEDEYADAVKKGIVKAHGMSMYAIYKIFHKIFNNYIHDFSKTKLNKLISVIRAGRNEITHGNPEFTEVNAKQIKRQITTFEELINFVQNTITEANVVSNK
ncbi:hypothetical protein [Lactiplantibacillus modestisalitolerans]|uniref:Apea-like HEPN domain-containing protein n=1 Tax=Lactiplantibacillus modestisalitolerans TaxID=1457219 RepID=A0ABV5WSJ9_9LACO|nr:hypothetical protein [Lactiplantibacillus modestisalitolerans]